VRKPPYKNALPHAVDTPDGGRLEHAACQQQPSANAVLVLLVLLGGLGLCFGDAIFRFGDANDHHHLVMGPDDIPVDTLGLWIDRSAALIVQLLGTVRVLRALALNHIVIW
jgi:hypothetical protein